MLAFDPYSPAIDADPFPYYQRLRDEAPCFWSAEAQMWVLSRYADIVSAGQDWQTYSSASGNLMTELPGRAGATLGSSDPPKHDRLRGLIQHAFMKRNLLALEEPIRDVARQVFGQLAGVERFDFKEVSSQFTVKVLMAALGLPMGDEALVPEAEVRENAVLMVQSDARTRAKGPEHIAAYNWMQDYAAKVIAMRRAEPRNDLISNFALAEIDDDREVLLTTTTLIMAGVESLGGFMMMFAYNLASFGYARAAVVANPALLPDAIEESLRFNTSAQRFRRRLMKDVTLHGQTMKEGDFVCLAYGSGNRDERQYPNPDVYDITRKPRGHLGFGGGVHACLGTAIARLAVKIAFDEFHKVVPVYRRVADQLPWMPSSTFRSPLVLDLTTAPATSAAATATATAAA